jgi:hypothetical protein
MLALYLTEGPQTPPGVEVGRVGILAPPFMMYTPDEVHPSESLGGFQSASRVNQLGFCLSGFIKGIVIERVSGANGEGYGSLEAIDGDSLRWTAPGGSPGEAVQIANGETKLLESGDDEYSKFVVVSCHTADELKGSATVELVPVFNNVIGSSNVSDAERQAGEVKLRCIAYKNMHSTDNAKALKIWLATLGTQRTSDTTQLPASGAGTIETTGSFADWPSSGFCRVTTAAESLREIVYYSSRTDTVLTVPAAGRGLLGTSESAGASDDKLDAVPGIKIAKQDPTGEKFSVCDDENDTSAVSGLSWNTGITEASGISVGDLTPSQMVGIWLWLVVPAGQSAGANLENAVKWSFSAGEGVDEIKFEPNIASGKYRVADDSLGKYELYRGVDTEPDLEASPWETFTTLPHETAALANDHTYYFTLRERNKYNLISQNIESEIIEIDDQGDEAVPVPDSPQNVSIEPAAAGKAFVQAQYIYDSEDDNAATHWAIYLTDDGSTPDPEVDEPTVVAMFKRGSVAALRWTSPAADNGDTIKVLVRSRRVEGENNYDSSNTDIYSTVASTLGPEQPAGRMFLGHSAEAM